ncbi:hypothetical protein QBC38DRAFT_538695 [Podospora fimiseda]|uniref:Ricin B lectin domain-containing protein n=1 Tax=Podospora fimiseda TaxID=252190 RepID=A0AAN7BIE2_9PEZI|nr:hypothetical protein QBC38DRAFT_538695 [Podospora fimiseda]
MLTTSILTLALVATGLAQVVVPEGYQKFLITSAVDAKFVIVPKAPLPPKSGGTIVVQVRNDKPEQHWYLTNSNSSRIQYSGTNLCLDAGAKSNWKDMGTIWLKDCSETEVAQRWSVLADGRIALQESPKPRKPITDNMWRDAEQCIDLVYMQARANNAVGLYTCAGLGNTGAKDKGINWPLVNVTTP